MIVGDGQKVWIYDADLNQVSSRKFDHALGATPAAVLAGGSLDKDFDLAALPDGNGLAWAEAKPKAKDGSVQSLRVGFKGKQLAAIEILDAFGQRSLLQFSQVVANPPLAADHFRFKAPPGRRGDRAVAGAALRATIARCPRSCLCTTTRRPRRHRLPIACDRASSTT